MGRLAVLAFCPDNRRYVVDPRDPIECWQLLDFSPLSIGFQLLARLRLRRADQEPNDSQLLEYSYDVFFAMPSSTVSNA